MHWADHTAQRLRDRGGPQVSCSGITPSGEFHIGHLREILSAEMIHRACLDGGLESDYVFIVDSMDPLRRVYDFLSDSYLKYIGHPLAYIPAPGPDGEPGDGSTSYAEHFLGPFLEALSQIGVKPKVVMNHETYESGGFAQSIDNVISKRGEIREIIEKISGRELDEDWFPYNPRDSSGSMDGVKVTGYEKPFVSWVDSNGVEGRSDIRKGDGKLPWRIDWAARWIIHGITCEPAGKDHGASGGSYDTGIPICRLLGGNPPDKITYEWIQLKGMGAMSSSSGVTVGPMEALGLVPPEIMRFVIARSKMGRHIDFDTGASLFRVAEEYERLVANPPLENEGMSKRQKIAVQTQNGAIRMSQLERGANPSDSIGGVSFGHLSLLTQIKNTDEGVWDSLRKSGHVTGEPSESLVGRLSKMRNWIGGDHFPEDGRIRILTEARDEIREEISEKGVDLLGELSSTMGDCEWNYEAIEKCIREAFEKIDIPSRDGYIALYLALLGRQFGPRAATIIGEMEREDFVSLAREYSRC